MTNKHTPGPWEIYLGIEGYGIKGVCGGYYGDIENEADARLIAAAPELLEAAKLVIAWYEAEDDHSGTDFYERVEMCRESETALRAAIAKATGAQT